MLEAAAGNCKRFIFASSSSIYGNLDESRLPTKESDSKGYTLYFSPPEQMDREALLPESDFYSLGMTMIYALGGGLEHVERREVPQDVPDPICKFIQKLVVRNVFSRPNWEKENLFEAFQEVREQTFGRARSDMKPIPGF